MRHGRLLCESSYQEILQTTEINNFENFFLELSVKQDTKNNEEEKNSTIHHSSQFEHFTGQYLWLKRMQALTCKNAIQSFRSFKYVFTIKSESFKYYKFFHFSFVFGLLTALWCAISFHFVISSEIYGLKLGVVNEETAACANSSKLSCTFLHHLSNDHLIGTKDYKSFDAAFHDLKNEKVHGILQFSSNFSKAYRLTNDDVFLEPTTFGDINIHFYGANFHVSLFMKIRIMKVFEKFNAQIAEDFGLSKKVLGTPFHFEMINKASDTGFRETLAPSSALV
jgi:hypothetical protein